MRQNFVRQKEMPTFFGQPQFNGKKHIVADDTLILDKPELFYKHPNGEIWVGDSIEWLNSLTENSVDLVFADPPYNIKKADWDNFESQQKYIEWSLKWIEPAARALKKSGTLYVCGFSEILADLKAPSMKFFKSCRWIVWNYKNKANLGKDWGRSHESILLFRKSKAFTLNIDPVRIPYSKHTLKYPDHPQALTSQYGNGKQHVWKPNPNGAKPQDVLEIPTTCNGMHEKTPHPTQKPELLIEYLIKTYTKEDEVVLDFTAGSGTTAIACLNTNRQFIVIEKEQKYYDIILKRVGDFNKNFEPLTLFGSEM